MFYSQIWRLIHGLAIWNFIYVKNVGLLIKMYTWIFWFIPIYLFLAFKSKLVHLILQAVCQEMSTQVCVSTLRNVLTLFKHIF